MGWGWSLHGFNLEGGVGSRDVLRIGAVLKWGWGELFPVAAFSNYETIDAEKVGTVYRAAGAQKLVNVGEQRPPFKTNGAASHLVASGRTRPPVEASASGLLFQTVTQSLSIVD